MRSRATIGFANASTTRIDPVTLPVGVPVTASSDPRGVPPPHAATKIPSATSSPRICPPTRDGESLFAMAPTVTRTLDTLRVVQLRPMLLVLVAACKSDDAPPASPPPPQPPAAPAPKPAPPDDNAEKMRHCPVTLAGVKATLDDVP